MKKTILTLAMAFSMATKTSAGIHRSMEQYSTALATPLLLSQNRRRLSLQRLKKYAELT